MTAQKLLKQARLDEALGCLQAEIGRQPGDIGPQFGLFQLFGFKGQRARALSQVQAAVCASLRHARSVVWQELGGNCLIGTGVRVISADCGDYPIMSMRTCEFVREEGARS